MYGVHRLHLLQELNLSNNKILTIEGLKELTQLKHLNLQGNTIKSIEHLNTNQQLEYLNLAENAIGSISDISMLKQLKVRKICDAINTSLIRLFLFEAQLRLDCSLCFHGRNCIYMEID